jgi:hypothetical protein
VRPAPGCTYQIETVDTVQIDRSVLEILFRLAHGVGKVRMLSEEEYDAIRDAGSALGPHRTAGFLT